LVFSRSFCILIIAAVLFSSFALAAAPTVASTTHPQGKYSGNPFILMSVSYGGATKIVYVVDRNTSTIPEEATATIVNPGQINLGTKADGTYYFHARAKTDAGLSDTAHYEIKVDNSPPPRPENPAGSAREDGSAYVEWTAPKDELSGVDSYIVFRSPVKLIKDGDIFREFNIRDGVVKRIATGLKSTNYIDTDILVGKGRVYFYKIQAVDAAGNPGNPSIAATVRTLSLCDLKSTITATLKDSNLSISLSADGRIFKGTLLITTPGKEKSALIEGIGNTSSANVGYPMAGKINGDYNIFFDGKDSDGDVCTAGQIFAYDTASPEVKILFPPASQELSELVHFRVRARDLGTNPSGIFSVKLYLQAGSGEALLGDANKSGDEYTLDWNSTSAENGRSTIIARALDRGANRSEDKLAYNIKNTVALKSAASVAITGAEAKRLQAIEYVASLRLKDVEVPDANGLLAAGDANLSYARALLKKGDFLDLSKKGALDAQAVYASILSKASAKTYGTKQYSYNEAQLEVFLRSSGINSAQVLQSKELITKLSPTRRLEVLEVSQDSNTHYLANIVLSLKAPDKNSAALAIIEVIPKKFADSASRIFSNTPFEVLEADPTIAFREISADANSGKMPDITYSLKGSLTKAQADALLSSSLMDSYLSPPILLPSSSRLGYSAPPKPAMQLPKIDFGNNKLLIIGAIVGVLFLLFCAAVIAVVAIWYFFFRKKKGSH